MPSVPPISPAFATPARGLTNQAGVRPATNRSRVSRRLSAGCRCLAVATVACLTTGPLFHKAKPPSAAHPVSTAAPVSVTADIARRLTPETTAPGTVVDGALWAGMQ